MLVHSCLRTVATIGGNSSDNRSCFSETSPWEISKLGGGGVIARKESGVSSRAYLCSPTARALATVPTWRYESFTVVYYTATTEVYADSNLSRLLLRNGQINFIASRRIYVCMCVGREMWSHNLSHVIGSVDASWTPVYDKSLS